VVIDRRRQASRLSIFARAAERLRQDRPAAPYMRHESAVTPRQFRRSVALAQGSRSELIKPSDRAAQPAFGDVSPL
jgi:hypothetical protein